MSLGIRLAAAACLGHRTPATGSVRRRGIQTLSFSYRSGKFRTLSSFPRDAMTPRQAAHACGLSPTTLRVRSATAGSRPRSWAGTGFSQKALQIY